MSLLPLRKAFFDGYLEHHPEEATTLGSYAGAARLRDHRPEALEAERRWYVEMDGRLGAVDREALSADDQLDLRVMRRVVDHHLHLWDRLWCAVDWSIYPYMMAMAQRAHAESDDEWRALGRRLAEVPRFLAEHEANVARGIRDGLPPDGALAEFFATRQLPPAIAALRELAPRAGEGALAAAEAYERHAAWLIDTALPEASAARRLGEAELGWRWRHTLGIEESPARWIDRAREELARVQEMLVRCAAEVDGSVRDLAGARALTTEMQGETLARDEEVVPYYRGYVDRALAHVVERGLFHVPDGYAIGVEALPPGFGATGYAAQNWPAPLLDARKLGHFLVAPEAKSHRTAWAADLAVHEGLPGHHLQSFWWQRRFGGDPAPVRFLLVHDQVAIARHDFGPMLNIEGYAVYAEELMRATGFFTPAEELFVLMAHGVRAARVVADLSLHAERMDEDEARAFLSGELGLPDDVARAEVRRYLQIPLQASTYLIGRLAIEELIAESRDIDQEKFALADFHERFFGFGPVDPAAIRAAMRHGSGGDTHIE